ncbi:MFS general substrate transporter [Penicillium samsonianum]|uniref:MFS general substrate transporter n=1 Tax=Penicillium samsonianum TaxID=1882272 RepID=UPI002548CC9F|nr:MFS general substrate transporter [Penicillium samsonianum]KAJ6143893.1 MFS general substrate transporter [Penicillium samsonianum]
MKSEEPRLDTKANPNICTPDDVEYVKGREEESLTEKAEPLYCILSEKAKILTICTCALVTFLSPIAVSMYLPALGSMARDIHVSTTKINLTITAYKVFQAVSPLLTASLSDLNGRRPVIIASLLVFFGSSIGLALQTEFPALLVLRCIQGFASASAMVISGASIVDLITRGERGKYMFYSSLGTTIGPAIGPTLGGILTQYLGWRSIFWFLAITAGVIIITMLLFLRETCRAVVGNGSLAPQTWNKCALQLVRPITQQPAPDTRTTFRRRPGIIQTLKMLRDRHIALLVICDSTTTCASSAIVNSLTTLLAKNYKLSPLYIGLCYLPFTLGGLTTRWTAGLLADRLFRHQARRVGEEIQPNRQSPKQLRRIPLEKARLGLGLPFIYLYCLCVVAFGWVMDYNVHLAAPLIILFFCGNASGGVNNTINMLAVDLNADRPASTRAAMSLVNRLVSAGAVAAVAPLIEVIGIGWVGVLLAVLMIISTPALWTLYFWGQSWREAKTSEED